MIEQIKQDIRDFQEGKTSVFTYKQFVDYFGYLICEVQKKDKTIEGLKETLGAAIMFLQGNELFVKAEQIKKMRDEALKEGETQ